MNGADDAAVAADVDDGAQLSFFLSSLASSLQHHMPAREK